MMIGERHNQILDILRQNPKATVRQMAEALYVSEPTVRRDLTELENRGFLKKVYGGAVLYEGPPDREIPFIFREQEKSSGKSIMGKKAAALVQDGMVIMTDGSTSAYHIVPYFAAFKDIVVITSGAKTAVALAEHNIRTFCTGGTMITHSFSYVGAQAEAFIRNVNADILFCSCRGLSDDGKLTDVSMEEVNLRRVMMQHAKTKALLCDSSKIGQTYFYNMGTAAEFDHIICETLLPAAVVKMLGKPGRED